MVTPLNTIPQPIGGSLDAGLLLGFLLLAAILGGSVARVCHIPRVVGYLVAGVALRFVLVSAYSRSMGNDAAHHYLSGLADQLEVIKTLALGLIMFVIGNVFEMRHLKLVGARTLRISLLEAACVIGLVGAACSLVLMAKSDGSFGESISVGLLLGIVALATAPAATLLVLREYDAKGPVSDAILTLTAVNNTLSVVLFHSLFLLLVAGGVLAAGNQGDRLLWWDLLLTTGGSVALGAALGFVFSVLYSKVVLPEFLLVFLAVLIGLGAGAEALSVSLHLSFNFLLTCLFLGAVFCQHNVGFWLPVRVTQTNLRPDLRGLLRTCRVRTASHRACTPRMAGRGVCGFQNRRQIRRHTTGHATCQLVG